MKKNYFDNFLIKVIFNIQVQRIKKNVRSKKNQKVTLNGNDEEDTNAAHNGQTSSCYSSEDDSNASQELNGIATSESKVSAALNLNGKTRANRGSATDPQSLYARVTYLLALECDSFTAVQLYIFYNLVLIFYIFHSAEEKREDKRAIENIAEPCP